MAWISIRLRLLLGLRFPQYKSVSCGALDVSFLLHQTKQRMKQFLILLLTVSSIGVYSQGTNAVKELLSVNNENTYLAAPAFGKVEPTVFEAGLSVAKFFNLGRTGLVVEPCFKSVMRMLQKRSCPINTPSYMPSVTVHKVMGSLLNPSAFASFMFGHHSNGQDNSFYNENGEVNLRNGNFSTNYFKAGVTKKTRLGFAGIALERHIDLDRSIELNNTYGFCRLHLSYRSPEKDLSDFFHKLKQFNFIEFSMNSSWIFGNMGEITKFNAYKRLITNMLVTYKPSSLNGISVFFQYFRGQDYYNIHFVNTLSFTRVGLSIDLHN